MAQPELEQIQSSKVFVYLFVLVLLPVIQAMGHFTIG